VNLASILTEQCRARPNAAAIIETHGGLDRAMTFAELQSHSGRVAALLQKAGLRAGDAALIFHAMSAELYAVLLGVFRLGAVAMFLDPSAGKEHVERCCELQAPRALIAGPKAHWLRLLSRALRRIPLKFVIGPWLPGAVSLEQARRFAPLDTCELCEPETSALLTFTSGSTGQPKAAVRTHGFLLAQHRVLERHLKLAPGEVDLTTLPIFLLANLASGVTSVIPDADLRQPGLINGGPVLRQMQRLRVTRAAGSPALFERLWEAREQVPGALAGLGKVYTGGAPVFPRLLLRLQEAAPEAEVEAVYGSTEAEPIAHLSANEVTGEARSEMLCGRGLLAGAPIPEIQIAIIRDQWGNLLGSLTEEAFQSLRQPPEQPGEIVVAGDHVLKGYLRGQGDEETKFKVGETVWHRTGDAGCFDAQGRLWLLGRCSAKIADEHGELYPFAVECVAQEQPGVRRAALVALDGQRVLAVEPEGSFTESSQHRLLETLSWAHLNDVRVIPRLPVDARHNAKIDYPKLRDLLASVSASHPRGTR
jgi:acyl-CoA synthetase (AMP-forming)/AMP-acid ligase II